MKKSKTLKLTEGNIQKQIIAFMWPILLSSLFQQFYNITNSMIVGNYISKTALSAVSATNAICNIFNFLFYGIGTGAGIVIATQFGAGDDAKIKKSIDTSILFSLVGGLILTVLSEFSLDFLLEITNVNAELFPMAKSYLHIYFLGNTAVFMYQMCFFVFRSLGDSEHPLYFLILSSTINLILGVIFVRICNLSVMGTALATIIAQTVVDILCLRLLFKLDENIKFSFKNITFDARTAYEFCALGIPAGIQNMMIAISSMMVQSYINAFPNEIIAGIGVAERVAVFAQSPMSAISTVTVNMVSQNMGAKKYERAQEAIHKSIAMSNIVTFICCLIMFITAPFWVSLFNKDPLVIESGSEMIRIMIFSFIPLGWSHVYHGAIRGSGNVKVPMIIAVMTQCVSRFLFVYFGLKIHYDVRILYASSAVGFTLAGIFASLYFKKSAWTKQVGLRN